MVAVDRTCMRLALAGALLLGGCAHQSASVSGGSMPSATLAHTVWYVEEIAGQPVLDKAKTELRFESSGRVSGSTGCNTFTGSATVDTPRLTMSPLATTRRACEPELMAQEQSFLNAIGAVRNFSIDGAGLLHLIGSDGKPLMRLSRANP